MRRLLPVLIGATVMLLAGCTDKREVCAQINAGDPSKEEVKDAYTKLGIERSYNDGKYGYRINRAVIREYCEYYKN